MKMNRHWGLRGKQSVQAVETVKYKDLDVREGRNVLKDISVTVL